MSSANLDRVASFTRELAEVASRVLQRQLKVPAGQADELGLQIASQICDEYGGQLIYVPTGFALRISQRDEDLHAYYVAHQRDIAATAKQFEVTVKTAYQRIRMVEAAQYALRQGSLFVSDDEAE